MSKSWYVVNSYSGYENKAKEQLLERIERENLNDLNNLKIIPHNKSFKLVQNKSNPNFILVDIQEEKKKY